MTNWIDRDEAAAEFAHAREAAAAENVERLRCLRGLTRRDLADRLWLFGFEGMTEETIADIETCVRRIGVGELFALAAIFGVDIDALMRKRKPTGGPRCTPDLIGKLGRI